MKVICKKCNYIKEILEEEMYDTICILCGNKMILEDARPEIQNFKNTENYPPGDNFPVLNCNKIYSIKDLSEEEKQIIKELEQSFNTIGKDLTQCRIEKIKNPILRIKYRLFFLKIF